MKEYFILQNSQKLYRLATDDILYVSASGNYSDIYLINGKIIRWTSTITSISDMLGKQCHVGDVFVRLGRNLLINMNYLFYINLSSNSLKLMNKNMDIIELTAPRDSLKLLKESLVKLLLNN